LRVNADGSTCVVLTWAVHGCIRLAGKLAAAAAAGWC
jgi:hypothetical protein